ncbi:SAM-dependent methyltransferase [Ideonella sp. DXS22W]|uniref:SAM-dependent methyltransferase n=1 Tax=Pseudaquabacterium inlustre TaxID=2984192 RepID=A0ABU9CF15_9BURK
MTQAPATPVGTDIDKFIARLRASLGDGSFQRLALGRPHDTEPTLEKLLARRVALRGEDHLSMVWRHRSKDITKNLPLAEAVDQLAALLASQFHHAHLVTRTHDVQLAMGKRGQWGLRVGKLPGATVAANAPAEGVNTANAAAAPAAAHDRQRQHALSLTEPFLTELGVTDAQHRLIPAMARKWRQINKFVEVLDHAIAQSPLAGRDAAEPVRVLDFGAGRGYLTFAVQQRLVAAGRTPDIVGVELREDLVAQCNGVARHLGLAGLRFDAGDVRSHAAGPIDIMIALHACDIATDVAMHRGVTGGAAIIVCSPCCHKELRPQMHAPALLQPMLRHGIHMTEQAEMLTDTLRALLLQSVGYDTQVFEFISPEHTAKNKMVLAVRRRQPLPAAQQQALRAQVAELKAFYGVAEQTLERLLDADRLAAA